MTCTRRRRRAGVLQVRLAGHHPFPESRMEERGKDSPRHPSLDNHGMGTIFEELIRRFNEENNEEAGEHWTPRDVVEELMGDMVFTSVSDKIKNSTCTCCDGACGTGGMLTVAQERLTALAKANGKKVSIHLFGAGDPRSALQRRHRRVSPHAEMDKSSIERSATPMSASRCQKHRPTIAPP